MQQESSELSSTTVENKNQHSNGKNENDNPGDFPEIDHIGIYTVGIYLILSIPLLLAGCYTMSYVFTAGIVNYRCLIKECEDPADTTLYPSWLPNAVPYSDDVPATCTRYSVLNSTDSCSTTVFTEETESCDAWVYDPEERTILNEWDFTCDNNLWKLALPGTINNVGQFVGLIFVGSISDRYGRRNVLTVATTTSAILGTIRSFSVSYEMFLVFEFLDAALATTIYSTGFLLGVEFVGPKKRVLVINIVCCMYPIGEMVLASCAMWLRSWRHLLRAVYIPGLLALLLPLLLPESVRWLLSKGRVKEAETVLHKIATRNGMHVSEESIKVIRNWKEQMEKKKMRDEMQPPAAALIKEALRSRVILIRLIICAFCWITNTFVYYGLSLGSVSVQGNKYINFILSALVEIPAQFLVWVLADYVGRKPTLTGSFLLSGICCILTILVPNDWWYLPLIVFLGGKLCITVAFSAIYVYTAEIFPTPIRHSLLGFCSMFARIGSMLAPQVPQLAVYMKSLPQLLFGIVAITASLLSLSFPETLGIKLPDTIEEAKNIGKIRKEAKSPPKNL